MILNVLRLMVIKRVQLLAFGFYTAKNARCWGLYSWPDIGFLAIKMREIPKRKRQILLYVKDNPESTARDVSKALAISVEDAEMFLFRLFRAVLVSRPETRKGCFRYTLNERGESRLAYWESREQLSSAMPPSSAMPRRKRKEVR